MKLSTNSFSKDQPQKGLLGFSDAIHRSTNKFSRDVPTKSNLIMSGDNTSSGSYGGDFGTFGDIYGEGNYGGLAHFKGRSAQPISH